MTQTYHPLLSPLELPVKTLTIQCITEYPLQWISQKNGSTPSTSLAGSFGRAVWQLCVFGESACERQTDGEPVCQQPDKCLVHCLYKPYSAIHRRDFARPVFLYSPTLEQQQGEEISGFTLEVTLWGRQAVSSQTAVLQVIKNMGITGLRCEGVLIPFSIISVTASPVLSIAERLTVWQSMNHLLLEFMTPLLLSSRDGQAGYFRKTYDLNNGLPLKLLLANVAYEWVAWDIEDRRLTLDKSERHSLACIARNAARLSAEGLTVARLQLTEIDLGSRFSRRNQHEYVIQGFTGIADIEGILQPAMPWLLALSLAGGGQKRALGFGVVRAWVR
ncbi:hypothetical protein BegalDRAFT_3073 [Beggiatoa alba B18LD]|uniref:CRISPR-associated protein Cas6 C-terminal domain-containing protein n=1 Tax=Beggiatoa alba B18LD TaxID=395493 RepID=I3CJV5_9GAMM|nr:hypothetical protein [Beggiatoa alba]EIJ43898.1 hypothetical protein BegalDRAFT_3073 [Beggiatoa alba B18LD]